VPHFNLSELRKAEFFLPKEVRSRADTADEPSAVHPIYTGASADPFFRMFGRACVECRKEHFPRAFVAKLHDRGPVKGVAKLVPLVQPQLPHLLDRDPKIALAVERFEDRAEQVIRVPPTLKESAVHIPFHPGRQLVRVVQPLAGFVVAAGGQEFRGFQSLQDVPRWVDEELRRNTGVPGVVCRKQLTPFADEFLHFGCLDWIETPTDFIAIVGKGKEFAQEKSLADIVRARHYDSPLGSDGFVEAGFLEQLGRRHAVMIGAVRCGTSHGDRL
jgi:hypothetical protein